MTTTLRPSGPLHESSKGAKSRDYDVCVNSRPVGRIKLATHAAFGPGVAEILDLRIDDPDRGRGRATVAALAAEEVARGWGCARIEAIVPAGAPGALALATALGYVERNRLMAKPLPLSPPELPEGTTARAMTEDEYTAWVGHTRAAYAQDWIDRGVPAAQAHAKAEADMSSSLADGLATPGARLSVLAHGDEVVGTLWVAERGSEIYVYDIEVRAEHRGRGYGRGLMLLAERQCLEAGKDRVGLNVFAGNTPALRLYESLGYEATAYAVYKPLL
ncbi:GNAT family N-acetyltransferase [Streptomyces flavofungini]|uniref:GNAT family N-acetyltransferase n=1 Tax=Streptomyces flavofungini TaxID=68200 RepID=A0ABS0X455_9ACTN|nr:GNAT family N-acetyltransferase [Streptomyces flavofungini]MBJ3807972.1 GNAT family N-acetyltransferase [Streptomyces flavofungini]GHC82728.1 N-acetyltransferase [Streptomyces flavofungini]